MDKQRVRQGFVERLESLWQQRRGLLDELSELEDRRFVIRKRVAEQINECLAPAIRVKIVHHGNGESYRRFLEEALRGARIKHGLVAARLAETFWPTDLSRAVTGKDIDLLVSKAELNHEQAEKVLAALSSPETLFAMEAVELLDLPQIELRDGESYKDSASLSKGQKCTAILPILLLDRDRPLLIDQPEDNLDNRFIFETVVDSVPRPSPTGN